MMMIIAAQCAHTTYAWRFDDEVFSYYSFQRISFEHHLLCSFCCSFFSFIFLLCCCCVAVRAHLHTRELSALRCNSFLFSTKSRLLSVRVRARTEHTRMVESLLTMAAAIVIKKKKTLRAKFTMEKGADWVECAATNSTVRFLIVVAVVCGRLLEHGMRAHRLAHPSSWILTEHSIDRVHLER